MMVAKRETGPFFKHKDIGTILLGPVSQDHILAWQRFTFKGHVTPSAASILRMHGPEPRKSEIYYSVHVVDLQELRLSVNIDNHFETILHGARARNYLLCSVDVAVAISTFLQHKNPSPFHSDSLLFLSEPYVNGSGKHVILKSCKENAQGIRLLDTHPVYHAEKAKWNLTHRFVVVKPHYG